MDKDLQKKKIEDLYKVAAEKCNDFSKALIELRSIQFPVDRENKDEVKEAMEMGHEIDMRTQYLLKALLIQHGNVLFL